MKRSFFIIVFVLILFVSCVSQPAPAPAEPEQTTQATAPAAGSTEAKDRAKALVQGGGSSGSTSSGSSPAASPGSTASSIDTVDVPPPAPGVMTAEEEAFLNNYLARLQYMVYYDEKAGLDPQIAKTAVGQANRYFLEKMGLSVVDFDQIEKLKKDQQMAYQAETGGSIDIMQYLAQKYNADVYVELDRKSVV